MFEKIVVGLDGSEMSDNALRMACKLAVTYGSEIHVVHTPQPDTVAFALGAVAGYHAATSMPSPQEVTEAAEKIIESAKAIASEHGQSVASSSIERGEPAHMIVEFAEKCGADLIVTGRRGLGTVGALIQGSTSQHVNHHAKCATLSVV